MTTVTIDTTGYNEVVADLLSALCGSGEDADAATIIREEAGRLATQIVRFTPPQSQKQGKMAVETELGRLISEAKPSLLESITEEFGTSNIRAFRGKKGKQKLELNWKHVVKSGSESELKKLHYSYKNRRGKIGRFKKSDDTHWRAEIVVPKGTKGKYIKLMQSHVGRWKASWCTIISQLRIQSKIQPWVMAHVPSPFGSGESMLSDSKFPSVEFGSSAPSVSSQRHVISEAVRVRKEAVTRRVRLVLSGYNKDLARGMRIQSRAARTNSDYGTSGIDY